MTRTKTTKQAPDQQKPPLRAIWLHRAGSGDDANGPTDVTQGMAQAREAARQADAVLAGEFVYASPNGAAPSGESCLEVFAFLKARDAQVLVVTSPWDIADSFPQYAERVGLLKQAGVRVALPEGMGLAAEQDKPLAAETT